MVDFALMNEVRPLGDAVTEAVLQYEPFSRMSVDRAALAMAIRVAIYAYEKKKKETSPTT